VIDINRKSKNNMEKEVNKYGKQDDKRWNHTQPPSPRKFKDIGDSDQDLQEVKKIVKDKKHRIILVIRLESSSTFRKRYLMIVSNGESCRSKSMSQMNSMPRVKSATHTKFYSVQFGKGVSESSEFCILGVDVLHDSLEDEDSGGNMKFSIGFVLGLVWGTRVSLDGDGGFSVLHLDKHFVFKPVSVQALWTVIQTLHLITAKVKPKRHSVCLGEVDWVSAYKTSIASPQSCINEWNTMPDLLVRRDPDPDQISRLTADELDQETKKRLIKSKLREIMKTVDLDTITCKKIKVTLEEQLAQNLNQHKAFIDEEILVVLGQMDPASEIFDFLFLGSEWNASNLEELNKNGVTHILNVTKEIDNFFPSTFKYLNIREYDVEETDLMKYWDQTFNFIKECIGEGGKVLVHCKMGISRSASTVVAFAMKYFQWSMEDTIAHVKKRRTIINPNDGFRRQLSVYEGILECSKKSITFRRPRSKSEGSTFRKDKIKKHVELAEDNTPGLPPQRTKSCRINKRQSLTFSDERLPQVSQHFIHHNKIIDKESNCDNKSASFCPDEKQNCEIVSADNDRLPADQVSCHCYSQLGLYIDSKNVRYEAIEESRVDVSSSTNNLIEATNHQVRLGSDCPARTRIDQCTCNLELELKVPETPVSVAECCTPSHQTDVILRNLGNFPIQSRQRIQQNTNSKEDWLNNEEDKTETYNNKLQHQNNENKTFSLDNKTTEELSVKTLADMYEFKIGENPSKPPLPIRQTGSAKILESKIGELAKKLSMAEVSEC